MSSSISKIVAIIAFSIFTAGCKLAVVVGEGGTVQSASATRNCAEVSTCTFDISEANFTDVFTAVPLPGYKFERWQSGTGYLCWNNAGAVCALSNTPLKDIPPLQAIIATDAVFTIKPVFTPTLGTKLVVKDANGEVLGEVLDLKNGTDAAVRQVIVEKNGKAHGYMVDVNRMYLSDAYGYAVYWANETCMGKQVHVPAPMVLEPLFSNRYLVARKDKNQSDTLFLLQLQPPEQAKLLPYAYAMEDGVCTQVTTRLPLVPALILEEDYRSRYTPPFGVSTE